MLIKLQVRVLPGGPVVGNSPSDAGGVGSIPGQGLRSHMPYSQKTKHKMGAIM